jgi:hypothetical protein
MNLRSINGIEYNSISKSSKLKSPPKNLFENLDVSKKLGI